MPGYGLAGLRLGRAAVSLGYGQAACGQIGLRSAWAAVKLGCRQAGL